MTRVAHPIPAICQTAIAYADAEYQRTIRRIGEETVAVMGLRDSDGWHVDFPAGVVWRDAPDGGGAS